MLDFLFYLLFALIAVTLIGHGIWVAAARLIGHLFDDGRRAFPSDPTRLPPQAFLPVKGNDPSLVEEQELETTLRQIKRFRETNALGEQTYQILRNCIEARRRCLLPPKVKIDSQRGAALQSRPDGSREPSHEMAEPMPELPPLVRPLPPPLQEPALPFRQQFEKTLDVCQDVRNLALRHRQELLDWARAVGEDRRALLSPRAQLNLARLLGSAGVKNEALVTYHRLLRSHADFPDIGVASLEAGRLALQSGCEADARAFLSQALTHSLTSEQSTEARRLLQKCAEEDVPLVIPAEEPAVRPAPKANGSDFAKPRIKTAVAAERITPPKPRRSFAEVLATFMEESNIFWGELVGGLLMVGGSIALVISLWKTLEHIAYFPFIIFSAITAGIFGAGLYTLSHWKLESTSRGLLFIGMLLVPLDFLVMARLLIESEETAVLFRFGVEAVAISLFTYLMSRAARVLFGGSPWLLVLAVLGASLSPLAVHWVAAYAEAGWWTFLSLGLLPVACYVGSTGAMLVRSAREKSFNERQALPIFAFLGMATFAVAIALGFLVYWNGNVSAALGRLAFPLALTAIPILAGGLLVHTRLGAATENAATGPRVAGTYVALCGILVMLLAIIFAWPQPESILCVCTLEFAVLTVGALVFDYPFLHAGALTALAIGYLVGFHLFAGHLPGPSEAFRTQIITNLSTAQSGSALVALVSLLGAGGAMLNRSGRRPHAQFYFAAAGLLASASIALVNLRGLDNPATAALVCGFYAAAALAINTWLRRPQIAYLGTSLIVVTTCWSLWWLDHSLTALGSAVLALEALAMAVMGTWLRGERLVPKAWRDTAVAVGSLSLFVLLTGLQAESPWQNFTGILLAATACVLAWAYRAAPVAWIGSALLFGTVWHALATATLGIRFESPLMVSILLHATLVSTIGLGVRALWRGVLSAQVERIFVRSLLSSGLAASQFVLPILLASPLTDWTSVTIYAGWLSMLWLAVTWLERLPALFTVAQVFLSLAVAFGVTAWLAGQPSRAPFAGPLGLHAYGIGFAVLGLFWACVRKVFRAREDVLALLETPWPSLDRAVVAILVPAQMLLAVVGAVAGVETELGSGHVFALANPVGFGSFVLLAILAADLLLSLASRFRLQTVGGLVLLAGTVPLLLAWSYASEYAAGSVLRWSGAIGFLLCSLPLWLYQERGNEQLERVRTLTRRLLIGAMVIPPLLVTSAGAMVWIAGSQPQIPHLFGIRLEWVASHVLPLLLICVGLTGHAFRERSAGYAFAAGAILNLAAAGGYALAVLIGTQAFGIEAWVRTFQWAIVTASLWCLAWLGACRWITSALQSGNWLRLQVALAGCGNAFLLSWALWLLAFASSSTYAWTTETGSLLGWFAFGATLVAGACRHRRLDRTPEDHAIGLIGMAILGLAACTVSTWHVEWGYRTLMLGWATFAPALVAGAWIRETSRRPEGWLGGLAPAPVAFWVRVIGCLVLALSLKAAFLHADDRLWSATALALAGGSGAVMAIWQRREDWASLTGVYFNLAASLVVWHFHRALPFPEWGILLAQSNIIASATGALIWLGARRRLYGQAELTIPSSPLLGLQVSLGIIGSVVLFAAPLILVVKNPQQMLPAELLPIGFTTGWIALILPFLAAFQYASQVAPMRRGHVLAAFGMMVGILAAGTASQHDDLGHWLAFHVLIGSWIGTGLLILSADMVAGLEESKSFSPFPWIARALHFSARDYHRWLDAVGILVLGLAMRATWEDPSRPYWSAGSTLAVSAMAAAVALRSRSAGYVYASGLLINLAGTMIWLTVDSSPTLDFAYTQVVCLAVGATLWSAVELLLGYADPPVKLLGSRVPFRHVAAVAGSALLVGLACTMVRSDLMQSGALETAPLSYAAFLGLLLALVISLWDDSAYFVRAGLYALGLIGIAYSLHAMELEPQHYGWAAGIALALYLVAAAFVVRSAPLLLPWKQVLRLPKRSPVTDESWFLPFQAALGLLVLVLSLWMAVDFESAAERLAGPLSVTLLVLAGLLLTGGWETSRRYATLCLGAIVLVEIAWAFVVGPETLNPWLYRSVLLLISLALTTVAYRFAAVRLLPAFGEWARALGRTGPVMAALSCIVFFALLGQEAFLYDAETSMAHWAVGSVVLAVLVLIAAGISLAVSPKDDPLGLSSQARTIYVYAGEVLLGLVFVHLRLTVPELFHRDFVRFWPFVIMAIAFAGVGLGELFERRGLRVLSNPLERTGLFLPLLPLLAFWVVPLAQGQSALLAQPGPYGKHAAVWFLVGGLYSLVAIRRRSTRFALLAALTANAGLWALLYHNGLAFLTHAQMWLIPLALIVLVAEHINRDRLGQNQSAMLRYVALLVIYASSTGDMFIAGLGESVILPLVLAILSITGILAGILLRVRAFLYLGFTFLFLVIFTQIYHAAVGRHQPWVWWVSLIVLGAAIIALFAVFEKRRNDVLRVLEDVRSWN